MKIFLCRNGETYGPYAREKIELFLEEKKASADDLALLQGQEKWIPLFQLLDSPPVFAEPVSETPNLPDSPEQEIAGRTEDESVLDLRSEDSQLSEEPTEEEEETPLNASAEFHHEPQENPSLNISETVEKIKELIISDKIDFALDLLRGLGEEKEEICLGMVRGLQKDYEGGLECPEWMGYDGSKMVCLYVMLGMLSDNEKARQLSKQLTSVNLNFADLKTLPAEIYRLEFVENLSLEGNHLKDLPPGIGSMKSLNAIDLNSNKLKRVPACLTEAKNLQHLNLSRNKFKKNADFWSDLGKLINLKSLGLGDNSFGSVPDDLSALCSLETLNLSGVSFKKEQLAQTLKALGCAPSLCSLDLSGCAIARIPDEMLTLVKLKSIELGNNKLKEVPLSLNRLPDLESLSIWGNPVVENRNNQSHEDFPPFDNWKTEGKEIDHSAWDEPDEEQLNGLSRELLSDFEQSFEYGGIDRLDETIDAIAERDDPNLLSEVVRGCSLDENGYFMTGPHFPFPNWIDAVLVSDSVEENPTEKWKGGPWSYDDKRSEASGPYYAMTRLMAYLPQNEKIHPSLLIENVKRLFLILPERMPSEIGCFSELEELVVSRNDLLFLPSRIGELTNLKILSLNNNSLTELPPAMAGLKNLRHLGLNDNSIGELPQWIGELTELRILDLAGNRIREIPSSIGELTNLQFLGLRSNKLRNLPPEIGKLQSLMQLWLGSNKIEALPEELYQVDSLLALGLVNNPCIPTDNKWLRQVQLSHRPDKINLMAMKSDNPEDAKWILNNALGWNGS